MHSGGSGYGGSTAPPFTSSHPVQTLPLICTPAPAWPASCCTAAPCCRLRVVCPRLLFTLRGLHQLQVAAQCGLEFSGGEGLVCCLLNIPEHAC